MAAPPQDWLVALRHSKPLYGALVCKTPLQGYAIPAAEAWTPTHAMAAARDAFGHDPVAVFDLTSGGGFYNRGARPWGTARYHVIPCLLAGRSAGRDDPPTEDAWHAFWLAMQAADGGGCIVHCRHGFNRSGWMLCRYAVVAGLAPNAHAAVAAFAEARPPGIYKVGCLYLTQSKTGQASCFPGGWQALPQTPSQERCARSGGIRYE